MLIVDAIWVNVCGEGTSDINLEYCELIQMLGWKETGRFPLLYLHWDVLLVTFGLYFTVCAVRTVSVEILQKGIIILLVTFEMLFALYLDKKFAHFSCQGHEGKFSVYIHASKEKPVHDSHYFLNREIRSDEVCIFV